MADLQRLLATTGATSPAAALANAYAQTLGAIFTEQSKPFEVEICVAEVGATPDDDELYRITYDGSVDDEPGCMAMGGQAEAIASVLQAQHHDGHVAWPRRCALAVEALGSVGGESGAARTIAANQLEVAVLDRRPGRAHVPPDHRRGADRAAGRATRAAEQPAEAGGPDDARRSRPTEAHKPTTSAGSADLEDKPADGK